MVKRIVMVLCLLAVLAGMATAQSATGNESDLFVKTIYLERVYPHQLGYMVTYVSNDLRLQRLFLPVDWFGVAAGRAEIVYGHGQAYPYVDIYWQNGEFSHVRLFVAGNYRDESWGAIDQTKDWSEEFNVDGLELRL